MLHCFNLSCTHVNPDHAQNCERCRMALRLCDRYRRLGRVGQGGFGRTFLAVDHTYAELV